MKNSIFFLKPIRWKDGAYHSLNILHCLNNQAQGIVTSLYLDLNILSKMRQVIKKEIKYEDTFLVEFVNIIKPLSKLVSISPGFALEEVRCNYQEDIYIAFEEFIKIYLPELTDAYNALPYQIIKDKSSEFNCLHPLTKQMLISGYSTMLLMHYISLDKSLSEMDKFVKLIDIMLREVGMIGAVESMLAAYCFCNTSFLDNDLKLMVNNFFKRSGNHKQLRDNSLNVAWDIAYYRTLAFIEVEKISGFQECWLVTADRGINVLSKYLFYLKGQGNCTVLMSSDLPEVKLFYEKCQEYYNQMMSNRSQALSREIKLVKFEMLIQKLEDYFLKNKKLDF